MLREYSAYDAKARFSELLRAVMDGERVVISYRGKPVAEMRPLEPVIDTPGALARFLHERD